MASNRLTDNSTYNRATRIEELRNSIPLGYLLQFPPAMTQAQLQEIPIGTITIEHEKSQIQCAVCFGDFKLNETNVRKLPCSHMYHMHCIFPWLKENPSCPTCRESLVKQEDEDFESVIKEHFARLMENFMRHLADNNFVSDSDSEPDTESQHQSQRSSSVVEQQHRSSQVQRDPVRILPRRAAALRAISAIEQIYRPRRSVNASRNTAKRSTERK